MQLVISNYGNVTRLTYFSVSTLPQLYYGTKIKVGETEVDIRRKSLTMERVRSDLDGSATLKLTANRLWFEFEDEVYERLIPDEPVQTASPSATEVNIDPAIIRGYIKANASFRGFQEINFENDDDREPQGLDGRTWIPIKTERGSGGDFFATPHRFFVTADQEWFDALGGGSGALGPGGIVYLREIERLNRTRFSGDSFAEAIHQYFRQLMTLGTEADETGKPWYTVDEDTGELLFRMGNTTLWLRPARSDD